MSVATARKPFEPLTGRDVGAPGALSRLCRSASHKRTRFTTIMLSPAAVAVVRAEGERVDGAVGTVSGIVIDYLARTGRFADVLKEAIADLEAKS